MVAVAQNRAYDHFIHATLASGKRQYQWTPTFTIFVQWIPVPEIKSRIRQDSTGLNLRS